jgi:hypothetical protein
MTKTLRSCRAHPASALLALALGWATSCGDDTSTPLTPDAAATGGNSGVDAAGTGGHSGVDAAPADVAADGLSPDAPADVPTGADDAAGTGGSGAGGTAGGGAGGGNGGAAGGTDAGADGAGPAPDSGPTMQSEACLTCTQKGIDDNVASCTRTIGCVGPASADKTLCEKLRDCMVATQCWTTNPNACYCGTSTGFACTSDPNGVCLTEALAAAKTSDRTTGGIRFFDTTFPSGQAAQLFVCQIKAKCVDLCKAP